jgi:hypothetical protein
LQQALEVDPARAMPRNFAPFNVGSVYRLHSCGVARACARVKDSRCALCGVVLPQNSTAG